MCCSVHPAEFFGTTLYAGTATIDGRVVHVLGYGNTASNRGDGPNAMILPFPAAQPMGKANVIATSGTHGVMQAYAAVTEERTRSLSNSGAGAAAAGGRFEVFRHGAYTIVMAEDAKGMYRGVQSLPENTRPKIPLNFTMRYNRMYHGWPIAVCIFDGYHVEAEPMFWWYEPMDPTRLFIPAVDAHDGNPPDLEAKIQVDTRVVVSDEKGEWVNLPGSTPANLVPYLSLRASGVHVRNTMPNGDFIVKIGDVRASLAAIAAGRDAGGHGRVTPVLFEPQVTG